MDRLRSREQMTEDKTNKLEGRSIEFTQSEQRGKDST
jgi:hypothetical protein